jgi:hypothetical protein
VAGRAARTYLGHGRSKLAKLFGDPDRAGCVLHARQTGAWFPVLVDEKGEVDGLAEGCVDWSRRRNSCLRLRDGSPFVETGLRHLEVARGFGGAAGSPTSTAIDRAPAGTLCASEPERVGHDYKKAATAHTFRWACAVTWVLE